MIVLCNSLEKMQNEVDPLSRLQEQKVDAIIQLGCRVDDLVSNTEYVEIVN